MTHTIAVDRPPDLPQLPFERYYVSDATTARIAGGRRNPEMMEVKV